MFGLLTLHGSLRTVATQRTDLPRKGGGELEGTARSRARHKVDKILHRRLCVELLAVENGPQHWDTVVLWLHRTNDSLHRIGLRAAS